MSYPGAKSNWFLMKTETTETGKCSFAIRCVCTKTLAYDAAVSTTYDQD